MIRKTVVALALIMLGAGATGGGVAFAMNIGHSAETIQAPPCPANHGVLPCIPPNVPQCPRLSDTGACWLAPGQEYRP